MEIQAEREIILENTAYPKRTRFAELSSIVPEKTYQHSKQYEFYDNKDSIPDNITSTSQSISKQAILSALQELYEECTDSENTMPDFTTFKAQSVSLEAILSAIKDLYGECSDNTNSTPDMITLTAQSISLEAVMQAINELYTEKSTKEIMEPNQDSVMTTLETHEDEIEDQNLGQQQETKERFENLVDTVEEVNAADRVQLKSLFSGQIQDEGNMKTKYLSRLKSRSKIVAKTLKNLVPPKQDTVYEPIVQNDQQEQVKDVKIVFDTTKQESSIFESQDEENMKDKLLIRLKNRNASKSPIRDCTNNSKVISLADIICSLDISITDPKEMVLSPNIQSPSKTTKQKVEIYGPNYESPFPDRNLEPTPEQTPVRLAPRFPMKSSSPNKRNIVQSKPLRRFKNRSGSLSAAKKRPVSNKAVVKNPERSMSPLQSRPLWNNSSSTQSFSWVSQASFSQAPKSARYVKSKSQAAIGVEQTPPPKSARYQRPKMQSSQSTVIKPQSQTARHLKSRSTANLKNPITEKPVLRTGRLNTSQISFSGLKRGTVARHARKVNSVSMNKTQTTALSTFDCSYIKATTESMISLQKAVASKWLKSEVQRKKAWLERKRSKLTLLKKKTYVKYYYYNKADSLIAIEKYTQLVKIAQEMGDRIAESILYAQLGSAYAQNEQYTNGIEFFTKAAEISLEQGKKSHEAIWTGSVGSIYLSLNEFPKARQMLQDSIAIMKIYDDKQNTAYFMSRLGNALKNTGDFQAGEKLLEDCIALAYDINDKPVLISSYLNLGLCKRELGKTQEAIRANETAIHLSLPNKEVHYIAMGYLRLGIIYDRSGEWRKALDLYIKSEDVWKTLGNRYNQGACSTNIGIIYQRYREYKTAFQHFSQALQIYESFLPPNHRSVIQAQTSVSRLEAIVELHVETEENLND